MKLKPRKTYSFGPCRHVPDAEVTTFEGTPRCRVVLYDPVGQYQPQIEWFPTYSDAHGRAKLYSLMMQAKYGD